MSEKKTKKTAAPPEKTAISPAKPRKRPPSLMEPVLPSDVWMEFDRAFDRFRRDFENALWPHERALGQRLPVFAEMETNIPYLDLEDKGNRFILTAEAPGFKKDDIEINICGNQVEISGCKEKMVDESKKDYLRKERMSESFYRTLTLPEDISYEVVSADLKDGVLEIVLPKKSPKPRKKIPIK